MRYYNIEITNAQTGAAIKGADGTAFGPWSSLLPAAKGSATTLGGNNPGALRVKFDIPVTTFDVPISGAFLRIWGIPLTVLYQAAKFNPSPDFSSYCEIKVYAGMSKGLPLANPAQSGLIVDGAIQQAFGNWQGTEQTIDFIIQPLGADYGNFGTTTLSKFLVFDWKPGEQIGAAINRTLTAAFPGAVVAGVTSLNSVLKNPYQRQPSFYQSMAQFSEYVQTTSANIVNGTDGPSEYLGVKIVPTQTGFSVFDGSNSPSNPKQIQFVDLIGQPSWTSPLTLTFKAVMRNDLLVGDYIKMPQAQTTTSSSSFSQYRNKATFQGTFQIASVRHLGDSRQPSADSWVTVVDCYAAQQQAAA